MTSEPASDSDYVLFEDFSQDSMVMFTSQLRGTAGKVLHTHFSHKAQEGIRGVYRGREGGNCLRQRRRNLLMKTDVYRDCVGTFLALEEMEKLFLEVLELRTGAFLPT